MGLRIVLNRKQCLRKRKQASGRHQFRVPGPGEMAEGARHPHGGRESPKVPPGSGFRVYIDKRQRAAGSRSEVVKGLGHPGRQPMRSHKRPRHAGEARGGPGPSWGTGFCESVSGSWVLGICKFLANRSKGAILEVAQSRPKSAGRQGSRPAWPAQPPAAAGGRWWPAPSLPFLITNDPGGLHQLQQSSPGHLVRKKHDRIGIVK